MMVTIKDVAKLAQVSPSTVSRVISDSKQISDETKKRVRIAMEELGYYPNLIARSSPFFSEVIRGISKAVQNRQYSLLLATAENYKEEAKQCMKMIKEKRVDGVILLASRVEDDLIAQLSLDEYPFVVVGRAPSGTGIYSVNNDNIQAAYNVVRHLLNLGHREIAFLNGPQDYIFCHDRYEGYAMAFREFGLEIIQEYVIETDLQQENGYFYTMMALGAYRAIKENQLKIPDDIAVVGFNNDHFSSLVSPPLTTVRIPIYEMGINAAEMMMDLLGGKRVIPPQRILSSELIIRDSCGGKTINYC
jgi:DNA-binding LacI/PurR family transcriptional regulator